MKLRTKLLSVLAAGVLIGASAGSALVVLDANAATVNVACGQAIPSSVAAGTVVHVAGRTTG
jgi:hypothetical protein